VAEVDADAIPAIFAGTASAAVRAPSVLASSSLSPFATSPTVASIDCQLERKLTVPGTEEKEGFAATAPVHLALCALPGVLAPAWLWPGSARPPGTISILAATVME
jgi:hypothetical protein